MRASSRRWLTLLCAALVLLAGGNATGSPADRLVAVAAGSGARHDAAAPDAVVRANVAVRAEVAGRAERGAVGERTAATAAAAPALRHPAAGRRADDSRNRVATDSQRAVPRPRAPPVGPLSLLS